jgi:hypothetical protein
MNRSPVTLSKALVLSGAIALALGATAAQAQVEVRVFPPAAFLMTSRPVYHEGRATYWYRGHWHYRQGGEWHQYRDEPGELRERRQERRYRYEGDHRGRGR